MAAAPPNAVPSQALVERAMTLCYAADTLRSIVLSAAGFGAYDGLPSGLELSTAQSSEEPQVVIPLTCEEAAVHKSWVREAKTFAKLQFDQAARELEGKPGMADRVQQLGVLLSDADNGVAAGDVYMRLVDEWPNGDQTFTHVNRGKELVRWTLDVVVRLSREEVGLVSRPAFDLYMRQVFGVWLTVDKDLLSRCHQAFQKSVRKLPGNPEAFVSNTAAGNKVRSRPRRAAKPVSTRQPAAEEIPLSYDWLFDRITIWL
jgi:hypothetical protein